MRILQIYKDFYPPVKGGIEGHINLLSRGLKQRGHDVEVLVSNRNRKCEIEITDGIRVIKVPQLNRLAAAPLNYSHFIWIKKLGEKADLLHFHLPNPTAVLSYLLSGSKKTAVITYHSDIVRQRRLVILYRPFLKYFLNRVNRIIATSPNYVASSNTLQQYKEKCQVVTLGIDLNRFAVQPDTHLNTELLRQKHGSRLILFIGKFRYYKGLQVLIDAMQQIDGKLLLIGAGFLEDALKKQAAANGLDGKITFLGELSDNDVTAFLQACDVFVLPSVERSEAFGIVQLEAMACGKPIVCTEIGTGTSYVNQHQKTGLVVDPNDPTALARAINFFLDHPEIGSKFGLRGLERVKKCFSAERMIDDIITVYDRCLNTS